MWNSLSAPPRRFTHSTNWLWRSWVHLMRVLLEAATLDNTELLFVMEIGFGSWERQGLLPTCYKKIYLQSNLILCIKQTVFLNWIQKTKVCKRWMNSICCTGFPQNLYCLASISGCYLVRLTSVEVQRDHFWDFDCSGWERSSMIPDNLMIVDPDCPDLVTNC